MNFDLLYMLDYCSYSYLCREGKIVTEVLNFLFAGVVSSANGGILASQGRTSLSAKMVTLATLEGTDLAKELGDL